MSWRVAWTANADAQLLEIAEFINLRDPRAARRLSDEIIATSERLGAFPNLGPSMPRGGSGRNREIGCRGYRIFYRVTEQHQLVEILSIWHSSQEPPLPES